MVEESTAASHLLRSDAGKLSELVAHFNVSIDLAGEDEGAAQDWEVANDHDGAAVLYG
jgi:hypothetical protein